MMKLTQIIPAVLCVIFVVLVKPSRCAELHPPTPNIIWIEADDLMPRFMNKVGEGFGHTPNLNRLATEGVYFPNAVCQRPMCGPSRNGLITNLYSHNLGFYRNGHLRRLPAGIWTFPPVLRDVGYQTAYIGKSHIKASTDNPKATKDETLQGYGFDYVQCTGERYALWSVLKRGKDISDVPYAFSEILDAQSATDSCYCYIVSGGGRDSLRS